MPALVRNITIEQGAVFQDVIILRDSNSVIMDLTGYSARMQVRNPRHTLLLDMSTSNGMLEITPAEGRINRTILAQITADLPITPCTYEMTLTPPAGADYAQKLYRGDVEIIRGGVHD